MSEQIIENITQGIIEATKFIKVAEAWREALLENKWKIASSEDNATIVASWNLSRSLTILRKHR